jgi:LPXTG-motif cell wall-anchored protein
MLRNFMLAIALLVPLVTFAEPNANALNNANPASGQGFSHAPEIDGSNAMLGLVLLGGIVSLVVRRKRKDKKED